MLFVLASIGQAALQLVAAVRSRLAFGLLLLIVALLARLLRNNAVARWLAEYRGDDPGVALFLGATLFHLLLALALYGIGPRDAGARRLRIQRGLWGAKLLLLTACVLAASRMPRAMLRAYRPLAVALAGGFVVIQALVNVHTAYLWAWRVQQMRRGLIPLLGLAATAVVAGAIALHALAVAALLAHRPLGPRGNVLLAVQAAFVPLAVGLAACTQIAGLRTGRPTLGVLQAATVLFFAAWAAWNSATAALNGRSTGGQVTATLFTVGLQVWSGVSAGGAVDRMEGPLPPGAPGYSPSFFHLVMLLAANFLYMTVSGWGGLQEPNAVGFGQAAVWVQAVSAALIYLVFGLSIVAPLIFTDRDFT